MIRALQQQSLRRLSTTAFLREGAELDLNDPRQLALHKLYRPERVTPSKRGVDLLKTPSLNKGMAFHCSNGSISDSMVFYRLPS